MDQGPARRLDVGHSMMEELNRFDETFLNVFTDLVQLSQEGAAQCTESIFNLSSTYMQRETFDTLHKFYDLYFAESVDAQTQKEEINAAVDDIFEAASKAAARGESLEGISAHVEDKKLSAERLAAANLQKQLEGLIVLDQGIRNEILPALSSMQFEDATRQRLSHVVSGWGCLIEFVHKLGDPRYFTTWPPAELAVNLRKDLEETLLSIAKKTSSRQETEEYYQTVLRMPVPEAVASGQDSGSVLLF